MFEMKKILIFKLCCFGDAVFITPAIRSLRKNYPDAEIVYAHSEWISSLIGLIPSVDRSILFENIYSSNIFKKLLGALKFILKVRKEKFDMVLFGHRDSRLSLILKLCGIRIRLGFKGTKHLTHTVQFEYGIPEYQRYLKVLSGYGMKIINSGPKLYRPEVSSLRKNLILNSSQSIIGIFCKGGYNPGTKMNVKRWELENYYTLTRLINREYPEFKVILMEGTPYEEKITVPDDLNAEKREISNELVAACDYYIAIDTGSIHIAAAMGIPTLSIFGPSDPRLLSPENYPGTSIHKTVWKKPPCSPCYTPLTAVDRSNKKHWLDDRFICATGTHICMRAITPNEVFKEFILLLKHEPITDEILS